MFAVPGKTETTHFPLSVLDYNLAAMDRPQNSVRDAVHGFVAFSAKEKALINSEAFQRLRSIRQLASAPWLYPGANHTRFEHCLGVMHLASKVFEKVRDDLERSIHFHKEELDYMGPLIRVAALLHDIGHPPFSHALEPLRPMGAASHEEITWRILGVAPVARILNSAPMPLPPEHVAAVCLNPTERERLLQGEQILDSKYSVLGDLISGDLLGADRMDYLLRDSHHAGVAYGKFDLERVLDTIRMVPSESSGDPVLAIEEGGIESAEAMLLARYFMFTQMYCHPVRRIYDEMLRRAIAEVVSGETITSLSLEEFLCWTEDEVLARIREAWRARPEPRIWHGLFTRQHPRVAVTFDYSRIRQTQTGLQVQRIAEMLTNEMRDAGFRENRVWIDHVDQSSVSISAKEMPVVRHRSSETIGSFGQKSTVTGMLPPVWFVRVYALVRGEEDNLRNEAERVFRALTDRRGEDS